MFEITVTTILQIICLVVMIVIAIGVFSIIAVMIQESAYMDDSWRWGVGSKGDNRYTEDYKDYKKRKNHKDTGDDKEN